RTQGPEELEQAVASIEASGTKGEWIERSVGHGRAYRFRGHDGHALEVFWEVDRYKASPEQRSNYPDRPQRRIARGIAHRQLDHLTVAANDVRRTAQWNQDVLGFRIMAYIPFERDPHRTILAETITNETSHDIRRAG